VAGAPAQAAPEGGLIALGGHCAQQAALQHCVFLVRDPESGHRFSEKITHKQKQ
jgi:hypothetical protein